VGDEPFDGRAAELTVRGADEVLAQVARALAALPGATVERAPAGEPGAARFVVRGATDLRGAAARAAVEAGGELVRLEAAALAGERWARLVGPGGEAAQ
jgi:hypothetical protein